MCGGHCENWGNPARLNKKIILTNTSFFYAYHHCLGGCVIARCVKMKTVGEMCVLGVNVWWVSDHRCALFQQTYVVNIPLHPVRNLHLRESGQSSYIHLEMFLQPWRREREAVRLCFSVCVLNSSIYKYYRNPFSGVSVNSERVLVCLLYCDFLCIYQVNEHGYGKLLECVCVCACVCVYVYVCAYACRLVRSLTTPVHSAVHAQDDKWTKITLLP